MAKVTLVQPSGRFNIYSFVKVPLVGSFYLAGILRAKGHDVQVICENFLRAGVLASPRLRRRLLSSDVVGLSIMTANANRAYLLAEAIRKENRGACIVFGGSHATFLPDEAVRRGDAVVVGEGEGVIEDIVAHRPSGAIIRGGPVESLDDLPLPDYSLAPGILKRMRFMPIATSRGCPFDCSFCAVPAMFGRKYRTRSPESVLEEINRRVREGWRNFVFVDDNFASDKRRARTILEGILSNNVRITWTAQVRAEIADDKELVALIRRTGGHHLEIGLESPFDSTLEFYGKRQSREDIVRRVHALGEQGVTVYGLFILGADTEDETIGAEMLRFCRQLRLKSVQFSILTPLPGSKLFTAMRQQRRLFCHNWSLYDGTHVVFVPARMTPRTLQTLWLKAYKRFYSLSRPRDCLFCRYMLQKWRRKTTVYIQWLRTLRMNAFPVRRERYKRAANLALAGEK